MTQRIEGATRVPARIGGLGVYATPAVLVAYQRTRAERTMRAGYTLLATLVVSPLFFVIPPHFEWSAAAFVVGLWFVRRAWLGEWVVERVEGTCARCTAPVAVKPGTVLVLPHTIRCDACGAEGWLETGVAPDVEPALREEARARVQAKPSAELGGRPPQTWSPAASDWRDRRR